jgi:hypothetical protein
MGKRLSTIQGPKSTQQESAKGSSSQISLYLQQCRSLYQNPLFSSRTQIAYRQMLSQLAKQGKEEQIKENVLYLRQALHNARTYQAEFASRLNQAVSSHWISAQSRQTWMNRFNSANMLECVRKKWIDEHFTPYVNRWKSVAKKREILRKTPISKQLTVTDVPKLQYFKNPTSFVQLPYKERVSLIEEVDSAIRAISQKQMAFHRQCAGMFRRWSTGPSRFLHAHKVGPWLSRIFAGSYTIKERKNFIRTTLESYKREWMKLRSQFNTVSREMNRKGTPNGFWRADLNQFLSWHVNQRQSYIAEAKNRLRSPVNINEDSRLTDLKQDIRHDLDCRDWKGANQLLTRAKALFTSDIDIRSMEDFLRTHRDDTEHEEKMDPPPDKILERMRRLVDKLPAGIQPLYIRALEEGYVTFRGLTIIMYNRVWLHRNGRYITESQEIEDAKSEEHKEKTRLFIKKGHGKGEDNSKVEKNIVSGDTAQTGAIDDDCDNAQVIYMDSGGEDAVLSRVRATKSDHRDGARGFLYQTSLVPLAVGYKAHENVVNNIHHPLKQDLRLLEQNRIRFTLAGKYQREDDQKKAA